MKPYFVGVDVSLTAAGLVVLGKSGKTRLEACLKPPKSLGVGDTPGRLDWHEAELMRLLAPFAGKIEHVCIEGYGFGAVGRAHALGEIGGTYRRALWRAGIPMYVAPPTTLKKFTTGAGRGKKEDMKVHAHLNWSYLHSDNNVVDAYCLSRMARLLAMPEQIPEDREKSRNLAPVRKYIAGLRKALSYIAPKDM